LAPAPAGQVPHAAPPGPFPFAAAAAALPADVAEFDLPAGGQDLYPLPPDSSDSSTTDEFFDAASTDSTQDNAADRGEDCVRLEGQGTQDHGPDCLEEDPDDHHPQRRLSSLFRGFPTPPRRVSFSPHLQYFEEEPKLEEEEEIILQQPEGQGGARGGCAQAHKIDPAHDSIDQQALYYDALLTQIDYYTEEASRALQALQGAPSHEQL
jgi:hypothetical protein